MPRASKVGNLWCMFSHLHIHTRKRLYFLVLEELTVEGRSHPLRAVGELFLSRQRWGISPTAQCASPRAQRASERVVPPPVQQGRSPQRKEPPPSPLGRGRGDFFYFSFKVLFLFSIYKYFLFFVKRNQQGLRYFIYQFY